MGNSLGFFYGKGEGEREMESCFVLFLSYLQFLVQLNFER